MNHETGTLTEGSIVKGLVLFALPLMLSNLFQQLYNSIDSAVVGSYAGEISLAAVGSTGALINLLIGFFLGIATGTGVLYAMHFGAGDWPGLKKICDAAMLLALAAGAFITVFGILFAPQLLRMMDMPDDVMPEATVYLRIFLAGTVPNLLYNVAAGMIRAKGDSVRPLVYLGVSGVLNLIVDLVFVAVLKMAAAGAALATVLAQTVSCVLAVRYLMKLPEEYRFRPLHMRIDRTAVVDVVRMSVPCGLQSSMFSISNLRIQTRINGFGSMAMAGVTAYGKLDGFIYMPTGAFSLTVSTYVGQNIGAGQYGRVRRGVRICMALAIVVSMCMGGGVLLAFRPVIGLFTDEPAAIEYARQMMWFLAPFAWVFAVSDILGGAMRGAGAATPVMVLTALCICVFRVIWLAVMLNVINDIRMVFVCYPISWALCSGAMTVYYFCFSNLKKTIRAVAHETSPKKRRMADALR